MLRDTLKNLLISFLLQLAGYFSGYLAGQSLGQLSVTVGLQVLAIVILGILFKLERRWLLINCLLPIGLLVGSSASLPPLVLSLLGLFVLLYLPTVWTRVPYYPTHKEMYQKLAEQLPANMSFQFLDAGCGDGALLLFLAKKYPLAQFTGVELSPLSFFVAWTSAKLRHVANVSIRFKSFWALDFANYDFVYAFLAPPAMAGFWNKAKKEMRPSSRILINSFPLPTKADQVIALESSDADRSGTLYIYHIT